MFIPWRFYSSTANIINSSVSKKAYEHLSVSRYLISSFKVEFDNTQFRIPREVSKWMLSMGLGGVHN